MRPLIAVGILLAACCAAAAAAPPATLESFRPSSRMGQFDASKTADRLEITLRVHYDFLDGDPSAVPGYADDEYRWRAEERATFKDEFRRRVEEGWSGRWALQRSDGSEKLAVDVRVREVDRLEDAQWLLRVRHYPPDAPDLPASVCGPGESHFAANCESNDPSLTWGTAEMASPHLLLDHLQDLEIAPLDLWYSSNDDTPPEELLERPPAWLVTRSGWSARLTGYASLDEVTGGGAPGKVRPTIALARRRTARLRSALVEYACRAEEGRTVPADCVEETEKRIRVQNLGAYGEAPYDDRRLVRIEIYSGAPMDTLTHEAGHMLGLGDEATDDYWPAGSTLESPDYAALVAWYRNKIVLRHDDDGIMSRGTVVQKRHYVTFLEALEVLSGSPDWAIVEP